MTTVAIPDPTTTYMPVDMVQRLLAFDTTSTQQGQEAACITYIKDTLAAGGLSPTVYADDPDHPSLVVRLEGRGEAAPLLLAGHIDVAPVTDQTWTYAPFSGEEVEGFVWGRGAVNMKGAVATMLTALMRTKALGMQPAGDIVLVITSDGLTREAAGMRHLITDHADVFTDVRYALTGGRGVPLYVGASRFYPIPVAAKHPCLLKATLRDNQPGLPSLLQATTITRTSALLQFLQTGHLPVHITPVVKRMLQDLAQATPSVFSSLLAHVQNPSSMRQIVDRIPYIDMRPLMHNTFEVLSFQGTSDGQTVFEIAGHLLPGYPAADMAVELGMLTGNQLHFAIEHHLPSRPEPDMKLFASLADTLHRLDPDGIALPTLSPIAVDTALLHTLDIQCYGFLPVLTTEDASIKWSSPDANERISVTALNVGSDVLCHLFQHLA